MLISITYLIAAMALIFTIIAFVHRDFDRALYSTIISIALWFAAAAGSAQVSIPYIFDNAGTIVTGQYHVEGPESWIAWIFLMMGTVMIIYIWKIQSEKIIKENSGAPR